MSQPYHLPQIRALLTEGFEIDDLRRLCFEQAEFRAVHHQLSPEMGKIQVIDRLIAYAEQGLKLDLLLAWAKEHNPTRYEAHQPYYDASPPVPPAELATAEQRYRERLTARYAEDAPYYIPLAGETTEATTLGEANAPRSARRRQQRALAEYCEWIQTGPEMRRVRLNTLREGVDKYPCLILLGDPGSGKTTALEHLAYQFAAEPDKLPLPLRLSEFGPGLSLETFIRQSWGGAPDAGQWDAPELAANLDHYLKAGRLFILFDALNEMPQEGYQERTKTLRQFIEEWSPSGNRFLVTCRVLDYGEELSGLQRVEIRPLNDEQIKAFLQNELPHAWQSLWQTLAEGTIASLNRKSEIPKGHNVVNLKSKIVNPKSEIINPSRRLLDMARNPYILTMMIDVFAEDGQLGQNRAELMERFTQILMGWAKAKCPPQQWLEAEVQREALSILAFEMQDRAGAGTVVETGKLKMVMPDAVQPDPNWPPRPAPADQVLSLAAGARLIELPVDRSTVRFYHQLLQEYFAARAMLKRLGPPSIPPTGGEALLAPASTPSRLPIAPTGREAFLPLPLGEGRGEGLERLWRWPWLESDMPLWVRPKHNFDSPPPPPPTGWEETTILAAGLAPENDPQLVQALLRVNPVLAGRCLHEGRARVDRATRQAVINALLDTIARPEVALRVRIAAGEVLGYLGDPRLGELVVIPAGKFWMGEDQERHKLFLPAYQVGKYPLTNVEYGRFIEAGGYQTKRWWTEAGWKAKEKLRYEKEAWIEPRYWQDNRFNHPNQPLVGISWYESVAYCRWLSAESGQPYRLPAEAEWEKAARGLDGRRYPWGDDFEANRLNVNEGRQVVMTTTPVGLYPGGAGPLGLFDCAGNVWEWCATQAPGLQLKPYPYDVTENEWTTAKLEGTNVRVLRGGSWSHLRNDARCAVRLRLSPYGSSFNIGVRVVSPI